MELYNPTYNRRFPKSERLRGRDAVAEIFQGNGQGGFVYPFRYIFLKKEAEVDSNSAAVLISVSKRYHKRANKRNLLKRRIREAYRDQKHTLNLCLSINKMGLSIALIYCTKDILDYKIIHNAIGKIIDNIQSGV